MTIAGFDHVALPTNDPEALIEFYARLGFGVPDVEEWRKSELPFFSVFFGDQKINFHSPSLWESPAFDLRGPSAVPGCGDLCFVWEGGLDSLETLLRDASVAIVAGPVVLRGGRGPGTSLYIRDPEQNLLEFIVYD